MRRPRFIAEQAAHAKGPLGRLIAFIMAIETWRENLRAIDALNILPPDHVLDVGCGHGRSLAVLAQAAFRGRVAGADPSDLMVEIAHARNRDLISKGRLNLVVTTAADLPFPDASFDKVLCVHVVYFWKDLRSSLRAIARVMKPSGELAMVFRTDADTKAVGAFPADVYRFPAFAEIDAALTEAGFVVRDLSEAIAPERPRLIIATRLPLASHAPQSDLRHAREPRERA